MQLMAADPTGGLPPRPVFPGSSDSALWGGANAIVWAPDGDHLFRADGAVVGPDGAATQVIPSKTPAGKATFVSTATFSPDGRRILYTAVRRVLAGGRSRRWTSAGDRIREGKPGLLLRMVSGRGSYRIRHAGRARLGDRHDGVGWQRSACASRSVGPNGRRTCAVGVVTGWFDACLFAQSHMLRREPRRDRRRPGRRNWFRADHPERWELGTFVVSRRTADRVHPRWTDLHGGAGRHGRTEGARSASPWDTPSDGIPPDSPARLGGG